MDISYYLMSKKTCCSFNTFTYYGRTKMTYMKRFCYIGSAVINNYCLWLICLITSECLAFIHLIDIICKKFITYYHIDKSRWLCSYFFKCTTATNCFYYITGYLNRSFMILLSSRHGTVTLVLAKIRSV